MRSLLRRPAALLAPALVLVPAAVRAQFPNPLRAPGPRAGIIAGLSSATLGGSDAEFESGSGIDKKRRNGFVAGGYLTFPIVPGLPLAIRPELLYVQKGVRVSGTIPGPVDEPVSAESTTKLDYLELPVLLQLDVPNTAGLRPSLYAGPSVAYLLRCRTDGTVGGETNSEDCGGGSNGVRKFDVSGVVGGQLGFGLGGQALGVGVRYTYGFTRLNKDVDAKNRALSVYGAIEFGR